MATSRSQRGSFGVRIRVAHDPGGVAAMIAPLAGLDPEELEATLRLGPVVIADALSRAEADELLAVCTSLGAEAHLLDDSEGTASTASGTLVGASVAGLIAEASDEEIMSLAGLSHAVEPSVQQTASFASADLQAALDEAVARRKAAAGPLPTAPERLENVPADAGSLGGHSTRVIGSFDAPGASFTPSSLDGSSAQQGRGSSMLDLDPFAVEGSEDRRATVPRLPAVDRPPPLVAPPPPRELADLPHTALETSGFSSESGPLIFRLAAPQPQVTETGSMPRPARLTSEAPSARGPDTLTDAPLPDEAGLDPFGALRAAPPPPAAAPVARKQHTLPAGSPEPRLPPPRRRPPRRLPAEPLTARRAEADHSPLRASLLSLVLPGMGQVYNGQFERAGWYALGALLVLPWLASVIDAWIGANQIRAGQRRAPESRHRRRAVISQLALNLSVLFVVIGGLVLYRLRSQPRPAPPVAVPAPPLAPPSAAGAVDDADAGPEPVDGGAPDGATGSRRPRPPIEADLPIETLMAKGRRAYEMGLYAEAEDIMHAVIRRDPDHKAAYQLLVEANGKRQRPAKAP